MLISRDWIRFAVALGLTSLLACGGSSGRRVGSEGAGCYPNETCDTGLLCLSTFCVRVPGNDGGDARDDATSADAKSAPHDGGPDSSGASGGNAAAGGSGAAGNGAGGLFVPAAHPALPQVISLGGPVLATPKVQPLVSATDLHAADIEAFLTELTQTSYWAQTTLEYGVGRLTVLPPITIPTQPTETTDASLRALLAANTSGAVPAWGPADPSTIYLFVVPEGSTVDTQPGTCCDDFGGYHGEAMSGATTIPYAVGCSCPGFLGITVTSVDERTTAISHELIEAATDPFVKSDPAFQIEDRSDAIWGSLTGGEVGDMCAFNDDATIVPAGAQYMVQRTWSNAAARRPLNPCVPAAATPYFNSFPALDSIAWTSPTFITRGLQIPIGQSQTIPVQLYSSAATKGPWTVSAVDYDQWVRGRPATLGLSLDAGDGQNGDVLHLTITPKAADTDLEGEAFILISHYGGVRDPDYQTNLTMAIVTN